jgi:hypothetical protein
MEGFHVRQYERLDAQAAADFMSSETDVWNTTPEDVPQAGVKADKIVFFRG